MTIELTAAEKTMIQSVVRDHTRRLDDQVRLLETAKQESASLKALGAAIDRDADGKVSLNADDSESLERMLGRLPYRQVQSIVTKIIMAKMPTK